jgi:hypothetical protein
LGASKPNQLVVKGGRHARQVVGISRWHAYLVGVSRSDVAGGGGEGGKILFWCQQQYYELNLSAQVVSKLLRAKLYTTPPPPARRTYSCTG